jgi:aerobic-type carbon monoxide dehydrogenase small subunit (CoxS/CutS family)
MYSCHTNSRYESRTKWESEASRGKCLFVSLDRRWVYPLFLMRERIADITRTVVGKHIITVEGIGNSENPHPLQERMAKLHGSQ